MRITIKRGIAIASFATAAIIGCKKETHPIIKSESPTNSAFLKIVHASPSFRNVFNNRDSFGVYTGVNKLTGAFLTYGSVFPAGTTNNYVTVPATSGTNPLNTGTSLRLSVQGTTLADSVNLYTFYKNLIPGRYYSLVITDSINSTDANKQMFIEDNFTIPSVNTYGVRLIHAVLNDTAAGRTVDLFSVKNKTNIFSNVAVGSATGFLYFPTATTSGGDTLILRRSGTNFEIARINAITQASTRVYSILYRGSALAASPKNRTLVSYINY